MLEEFEQVLNPKSLLEVVPEEILRAMMQGFFFGHRAGLVLIYDEGKHPSGEHVLKRLEPVSPKDVGTDAWRITAQNFNPFCASFRQDPKQDKQCTDCEVRRAHSVFHGELSGSIRYNCHMGLIDMTIPINVDGRVRGVISGGQKVLDNPVSLSAIQQKVREKAWVREVELLKLLSDTKLSDAAIKQFEESFIRFSAGLQTTVDTFHRRRQTEAERQVLLRVNDHLGRSLTDDPDGWFEAAASLIQKLASLVGTHVWMLTRRFSRFECTAASFVRASNDEIRVPAAKLITEVEEDKVLVVKSGSPIYDELSRKLNTASPSLTLIRSDSRVGTTDAASVVVVVSGKLETRFEQLFLRCVHALAYPAGVHLLFRKMAGQQHAFVRTAAFSGHHFKTPVQIAQWDLEEALEILEDRGHPPDVVSGLITSAHSQMSQALVDANRLMSIDEDFEKTRFALMGLIAGLVDDLESAAARRNIVVQVTQAPLQPPMVLCVEFQLRVALTNLVENAIKYSYENHTVDIEVTVKQKSRRSRRFAQICIRNYGVGFPEEQQEALFEFGVRSDTHVRSRRRVRQGIGLPQALEYIEAMGGAVTIDSFLLPARSEASGGIHRVEVGCLIPIL